MSRSIAAHQLGPEQLRLVLVALDDALPECVADLAARQPVELDAVERLALERKDPRDLLAQRRQIPRFDVRIRAREPIDRVVEHVAGDFEQIAVRVDLLFVLVDANLSFEQLAAQRVDVLPLLVHDVVVLEQVFADGEVLRLHLLLRALDRARDHPVLDRHAFFHAQPLHQAGDAIRPEDPHQVVFERQVEA